MRWLQNPCRTWGSKAESTHLATKNVLINEKHTSLHSEPPLALPVSYCVESAENRVRSREPLKPVAACVPLRSDFRTLTTSKPPLALDLNVLCLICIAS